MKSLLVSKDKSKQSGFTMIEVLVVVAIIIGFFAMGSFVDFNMYNRKLISTEEETLVSVLHKVRNQAMNNIYASPHGVHVEPDRYVIFREFPYDENNGTNEIILRNDNIIIVDKNGDEPEVIFSQLSGEPNYTGEINLDDGARQKDINIIENGLIDW